MYHAASKSLAVAKPAAIHQAAAKAASLPKAKAAAEGHVPFAIKKMKLQAVKPPIKLPVDAEAVLNDSLETLPTRRQAGKAVQVFKQPRGE